MGQTSIMTVFTGVESAEGMSCGSGYRRYLVALRTADPGDLTDVPDGREPPPVRYANSEAVVPEDDAGIRRLADLLWQDALGVSEMWWFANLPEQLHPRGRPTAVPTRTADIRVLRPGPLLMARLRSVSEVEALIHQIGPQLLICNWLAFGPIGEDEFDDITVNPDTSLCLDDQLAVREDMPNVFLGADLAPAWRYGVTQDLFHYDTGDPFFTLPAPSAAEFERTLQEHALRDDRTYYQLPFTMDRLKSFIKDGVVIVPSPGRH